MTQPTWTDQLASKFLKQYRRDRFWRNVRFFFIFAVIAFAIFYNPLHSSGPSLKKPGEDYVSLIRLNGVIKAKSEFSALKVIPELNKAFADRKAKGVVLEINSPGGSPVQASIIHDKIIALKKKYPNKKVAVVAEDSLASGAYLVAVAADKIYVNASTITGSIGVVMRGFGFSDAIKKLGVSRRVFTAGKEKSQLDSFQALRPHDVKKIQKVLTQVHKIFIADVVAGRKGRLRGNRDELFSGDFWTGQEAVRLGVADGTANLWQVLKKDYNVIQFKDYTRRPSLLGNAVEDFSTELDLHLQAKTQPKLFADLGA
jgi:protease IV